MSSKNWLNKIHPMAATLPESGIVEIFNYGRTRPGLIPFWAGESDLSTPDFICDAAINALRAGKTFYTYQRGIPPLRQAVADYLNRTFDTAVNSERVIITGSGMQGLLESVQALVGTGDEVIVITPVWPNIMATIHMQEAITVPVELRLEDNGWQLDLDELFAAVSPRTRAIFINSPGNPTGWIMPRADMLALRDFCRQHGLWLISDEVYSQFTYTQDRAASFLEIMEADEQLIVSNTFSKNWLMTGWRIGWVVIPDVPELAQVFENLVQYSTSGVATFLQYGCIAALEEGDDLIAEMVERCRGGRDIVCDALSQCEQVEFVRPAGAFYLFFRIQDEPDSTAFARRMVDEANVGLAPGTAFGSGGEGFVRLCFAASHTTLQTGVGRLVEVLQQR